MKEILTRVQQLKQQEVERRRSYVPVFEEEEEEGVRSMVKKSGQAKSCSGDESCF